MGRTANVNLVFSEVCVAPTKQLSIPRLKLLAILIGTRCLNYVIQQLQLPATDQILLTVSQCVLHWIKSHKPFPIFDMKFRYITTTQNPADLATRGISTQEVINRQLWSHGPSRLSDPATKWDIQHIDDKHFRTDRQTVTGSQIVYETSALTETDSQKEHSDKPGPPFGLSDKNCSSLTRLLRVTAWSFHSKTSEEE